MSSQQSPGDVGEHGEPEDHADESAATFARQVGARLRAIRQAKGLSLAEVEERSDGRWSSSAIGAYERGFRNLSLPRLKSLADFYRVPVGVLLGEPGPYNQPPERTKLVLSLEALEQVDPAEPVQRFVSSIIEARGDFNGRVLSLRYDDLKALCTLVGGDIATGVAQLRSWGVLLEGPEVPTDDLAAGTAEGGEGDEDPLGDRRRADRRQWDRRDDDRGSEG